MKPTLYEVSGLCIDVKYLVLGPLQNNTYIISDGAGTLVVDPSCEPETIIAALEGKKLDAIVLTHFHNDHIGAAAQLRAATGAKVYASAVDAPVIEAPQDGTYVEACEPCPWYGRGWK